MFRIICLQLEKEPGGRVPEGRKPPERVDVCGQCPRLNTGAKAGYLDMTSKIAKGLASAT